MDGEVGAAAEADVGEILKSTKKEEWKRKLILMRGRNGECSCFAFVAVGDRQTLARRTAARDARAIVDSARGVHEPRWKIKIVHGNADLASTAAGARSKIDGEQVEWQSPGKTMGGCCGGETPGQGRRSWVKTCVRRDRASCGTGARSGRRCGGPARYENLRDRGHEGDDERRCKAVKVSGWTSRSTSPVDGITARPVLREVIERVPV